MVRLLPLPKTARFMISDVLILSTSLPLVRKWFRNQRVTGLSFTARIERPQLYRGGSASKKDGLAAPGTFLLHHEYF